MFHISKEGKISFKNGEYQNLYDQVNS